MRTRIHEGFSRGRRKLPLSRQQLSQTILLTQPTSPLQPDIIQSKWYYFTLRQQFPNSAIVPMNVSANSQKCRGMSLAASSDWFSLVPPSWPTWNHAQFKTEVPPEKAVMKLLWYAHRHCDYVKFQSFRPKTRLNSEHSKLPILISTRLRMVCEHSKARHR